jgi:Leucine-rich repeat (LRR) protein
MIKKYKQYIKYIKEDIDHSDIDPWGEEDWEIDELPPVLQKAREQGIPFDQITILYCSSMNLGNLDGIDQLVNLEILYCNHNQLTSLRGIENLRNLKTLWCNDNQLTNLEGIENLRNLEILWCHNNNFSDEYKEYLRNYCKEKNIELTI